MRSVENDYQRICEMMDMMEGEGMDGREVTRRVRNIQKEKFLY